MSARPGTFFDESRRIRRQRLAALVAIALTLVGCGSTDHDRGTTVQARLQQAVNRVLAARSIPGASVAAILDGRLFRVVGGLADVDARREVTFDDEFRL